ncbi:MAG: SUMF1/EgtB/PvdO family nonheme iron enzyme [Candidatus Zhuqueibacterota bacterium]
MRKWSLAFFLIALILSVATAQTQRGIKSVTAGNAAEEKRFALVIGNGGYADSPLRNPVNDARAMATTLRQLGFDVMSGENLTLRQMTEQILAFGKKIKNGGVGLFYFAGHGVQVQDRNYLIPVGAHIDKEQDVEFEALHAGRVLAEMEAAGNRLNIVILDACRDNPFARSFRSAVRGLAQMSAPSGSFIAYATAPGQVASDGSGTNGLYTQELIGAMQQPGLKIEDVFKQVRAAVIRKSNHKQMPWESTSIVEDFYFVRPGGYQPPLPDIAAPADKKLDLSRYETEASRLAAVKAQWQQWQTEMTSSYQKAQRLDSDVNLAANSKTQMWQEFLTSYTEDNPYSQEDEDLRSKANGRKYYWSNFQPPKAKPSKPATTAAGIEWVFVPGGTFDMGDTFGEGNSDELPVHSVTVSDFYMSKTEVTVAQYRAFCTATNRSMPDPPGYGWQDNHPIENVNWHDAVAYCEWAGCRLPTEAEWEYAAREGGKKVRFGNGKQVAIAAEINFQANYKYPYSITGVYRQEPTPVASFAPNALGLYDMSGNVWECCSDWYDANYYQNRVSTNPNGPSYGQARVSRGGSWYYKADDCRAANRWWDNPATGNYNRGFRVVQGSPQ